MSRSRWGCWRRSRRCGVVRLEDAAIVRVSPQRAGPVAWSSSTSKATVLLDGAHNPDGAAVLAATLDELAGVLPQGRATLLAGVMADKEVAAMVTALAASRLLGDARFVASGCPIRTAPCRPTTSRPAGSRPRVRRGRHRGGSEQGTGTAREMARRDGGLLIMAGSLYLVGHPRGGSLPATSRDDGRDSTGHAHCRPRPRVALRRAHLCDGHRQRHAGLFQRRRSAWHASDAPSAAVAQASRMVAEGADVIDVGGESTRPGHEPVTATRSSIVSET